MLSVKTVVLALAFSVLALPVRREVPQEHSHNQFLATVRSSLNTNNPSGIVDPVFGLLGNAAAAAGAGKITDLDCLQTATADQAFTNAKAANDVDGMVGALIYRALERNTGSVGLASAACTSFTPVNAEIAALSQHQDPASANASEINKNIELELAKQISSVGGDPQLALKSGTFAPGNTADTTGKGNTCDDANDTVGCIFTDNLIHPIATADEITAAVGGSSSSNSTSTSSSDTSSSSDSSSSGNSATVATAAADAVCTAATVTVTSTVTAGATATASATAVVAAAVTSAASASTATSGAASGTNLQTFTGALGGITAIPVVAGGRGFLVDNTSDVGLGAALQRSCDVQHNQCADLANSGGQSFTVSDCDQQDTQCEAHAQTVVASSSNKKRLLSWAY